MRNRSGRLFATLLLLPAVLLTVAGAGVAGSSGVGADQPRASRHALDDIPGHYLHRYQQAAEGCPGLPWTVLAAIGEVGSDHGRADRVDVRSNMDARSTVDPVSGALGPMRLSAVTFARYARPNPPGGTQPPDPFNVSDSIHAAARMLCAQVAQQHDLVTAIRAHRDDDDFIAAVLSTAGKYGGLGARPSRDAIRTDFATEDATVPDPSGAGGTLTPRMATLYQDIDRIGLPTNGASCWDEHAWNPRSDHPAGQACDIFFDPDDVDAVAAGWALAHWLVQNQAEYGVKYVIWQGRIWSARRNTWRPYRSRVYDCPNPNNVTGCHYDHVHISVM